MNTNPDNLRWLATLAGLFVSSAATLGMAVRLGRLLQSHETHGNRLDRLEPCITALQLDVARIGAKHE